MSDRPSIEKEVSDSKQAISQLDKDIQQLRDWIRTNERAVGGMPESLRRITEDGITRARADLAQRENEMQRLRGTLAENQKLLNLLTDMDRKARDIATLEQEQEKIMCSDRCAYGWYNAAIRRREQFALLASRLFERKTMPSSEYRLPALPFGGPEATILRW